MKIPNELRRKSIHFLGGLIIPIGLLAFSEEKYYIAQLIIAFCTAAIIIIDVIRLNNPTVKKIFLLFFKELIRDHEYTSLTGATYLLVSSLICVYFFERHIVFVVLMFLAVGDTMAALVGRRFGRTRIFINKSLEGSLACFVSCFLIAWATPHISVTTALLSAFSATLLEVLPIPLDDNIRIPLISALVIKLLS